MAMGEREGKIKIIAEKESEKIIGAALDLKDKSIHAL